MKLTCPCGSSSCGVGFWRGLRSHNEGRDTASVTDEDYCENEYGSQDYIEGVVFGAVVGSVVWLAVGLVLITFTRVFL